MEDQWVPVFASTEPHQVDVVMALLEANDIPAVVINQQDSMYLNFNSTISIRIVVKPQDVVKAKHLLQSNEF